MSRTRRAALTGCSRALRARTSSYFLKLAQEMVAGGQGNSIIRPGWEFNGNWFAWSADGQAAAFVGYWQQIVNTMRSVAGQNFHFEWNPTMGDTGIGNLADFYPGNAYVDEIGLDVYDQSWGTYTGISSEWNTFLTEPYGLNWLASFAASQGKPITFPEWGLDPNPSSNNGGPTSQPGSEVGGGDDPTFINDMAQWISQHNVLDASYWDYNSSQLSGSSNPNSYTAFKNDFVGTGSTTDHDARRASRFDHDDDRSRRDDDHHARHNDDDDRSRARHDDRSRQTRPRRQLLWRRRPRPLPRRQPRRQILRTRRQQPPLPRRDDDHDDGSRRYDHNHRSRRYDDADDERIHRACGDRRMAGRRAATCAPHPSSPPPPSPGVLNRADQKSVRSSRYFDNTAILRFHPNATVGEESPARISHVDGHEPLRHARTVPNRGFRSSPCERTDQLHDPVRPALCCRSSLHGGCPLCGGRGCRSRNDDDGAARGPGRFDDSGRCGPNPPSGKSGPDGSSGRRPSRDPQDADRQRDVLSAGEYRAAHSLPDREHCDAHQRRCGLQLRGLIRQRMRRTS